MRPITAADSSAVADFVEGLTIANRWLVAFFRNLHELPREAEPYWSLWLLTGGGKRPSAVAVHSFASGVSYMVAAPDFDPRELESLLREELLPERLVGDRQPVEEWERRSPGFFSRASRREELVVLSLAPGKLDRSWLPSGEFRLAVKDDEPRLRELERLWSRERGEEVEAADFHSLIERKLVYVIEEEGQVAAMVRSNLPDGRCVHFGGLYVAPDYRGRRLGTRLVAGLSERIHAGGWEAVVDTSAANNAALSSLKSAGFREWGRGVAHFFPNDAWRRGG